jgi:peptidoglycan hydrolase-like protein with peptidoglycan-binding domain
VTTGVDCLDIEPGDAVPSDGPAFVHGWTPVNTNKPVIYANGSSMTAVQQAMARSGIARNQYYLWLADWDGSPSINQGYDAKQYWSTSGYDSDSFYDYMFQPPAAVWPLKNGSVGAQVTALQTLLNALAGKIGLKQQIAVDGSFGPGTQAVVELAQKKFGYAAPTVYGQVSEAYYAGLEHQLVAKNPPPVVVPVTHEVCRPVAKVRITGEGPHSYRIEFTYPKQGATPAAAFQVATSAGSHLGKQVATYPRSITCKGTGVYGGLYGGVNTKASSYIVAVRALAPGGHLASEWTSVKLPRLA